MVFKMLLFKIIKTVEDIESYRSEIKDPAGEIRPGYDKSIESFLQLVGNEGGAIATRNRELRAKD